MSKSFTTPLAVTPLSDGKRWKLYRSFTYHIGTKYSNRYITVPRGFVTDFASIPKPFLLILPSWAKFSKAPVLHDYLYTTKLLTRKEADDIFLEAMMIDWRNHKSRHFLAWVEYTAVRLFGWVAWR